jgi:hypothetical protein
MENLRNLSLSVVNRARRFFLPSVVTPAWSLGCLLARSIRWQRLLAETLLALLGRNIALLDVANLSRRRAFIQVLDELTQRILIALCFASDLVVLSVAVMCRKR